MLIFDSLRTSQSFASSPGVLIKMMDNCVLLSMKAFSFSFSGILPDPKYRIYACMTSLLRTSFTHRNPNQWAPSAGSSGDHRTVVLTKVARPKKHPPLISGIF